MIKGKKGQIGALLKTIIFVIVFWATYPFMQSAFTAAAGANTGFVATAIDFIPFIILFGVIGVALSLGGGTGEG